jgi:hypothetical protein
VLELDHLEDDLDAVQHRCEPFLTSTTEAQRRSNAD